MTDHVAAAIERLTAAGHYVERTSPDWFSAALYRVDDGPELGEYQLMHMVWQMFPANEKARQREADGPVGQGGLSPSTPGTT